MADNTQFGGGKGWKFGDRPGGGLPGDTEHCTECEAMLTDALDGVLSEADKATFDNHAASCKPCGEMVADARRGAAWLEMLRNPAPEPPAYLLHRILAETSWTQLPGHAGVALPAVVPHVGATHPPFTSALAPGSASLIAFPRHTFAAVRRSGFGQIVLQPRLAMTAAMAFFSIALTLNITGIHPTSLRLADLSPRHLRRDFYSANARVVQYYEGLRVVYELESRLRDLQSAQDTENDAPASANPAPAEDLQPAVPAGPEPIPNVVPADKHPQTRQHDRGKPSTNPRTSRREDLLELRRMEVAAKLPPRSTAGVRQTRPRRLA